MALAKALLDFFAFQRRFCTKVVSDFHGCLFFTILLFIPKKVLISYSTCSVRRSFSFYTFMFLDHSSINDHEIWLPFPTNLMIENVIDIFRTNSLKEYPITL